MSSTPHKKNVVENSTFQAEGSIHIGDITYNYNDKEVKIPHLLTNNIASNADHILGREAELSKISEHLQQNKPTVLVNGIGGIGKTSVAAKYVATYGSQYKHLAWLTMQSSVAEAFTNDLVLLKSLHIEHDVRQLIETHRLTDAFKLVVHKLNTLEQTLVVLDNVNNPDDLVAYKNLFDTARCHYLITSRTQPQEWIIVEIDHLPPDEAVNLFRKLAPSVSASNKDLKNLLEKLFYHTLLIELVAKAVENAGFSFAELQTMIETKFIHDEQLNEDIVSTGKHGDNYDAKRAKIEEYIWLIYSNVKDLGDDAKQILRGMALLPVATPFDRDFLKTHLALFDVEDIVPNLSRLVEWGWLQKEGKGFKMHPLVADVVVEHLGVDADYSANYIWHIVELIHYDDANATYHLQKIIEYKFLAERLKDLFFDNYSQEVIGLLDRIGHLEEVFGFYYKAKKNKEQAVNIAVNILGEDNESTCIMQSNLASLYHQMGQYNLSVKLFENILAFFEKKYQTNSYEIARAQSNLATTYMELGKYDIATTLFEKALEGYLNIYKQNHPIIGITQSNLALAYRSVGKLEKAKELLETALDAAILSFGQDHPQVAVKYSNLGLIFHDLKEYNKSVVLFKKALLIDEKLFGLNHPEISKTQSNLALTYTKIGLFTEAMELFEKALASESKLLGVKRLSVALIQWNLATTYFQVNRKKEAKELLNIAYLNMIENLGTEHPYTYRILEWRKHMEDDSTQLKKSMKNWRIFKIIKNIVN